MSETSQDTPEEGSALQRVVQLPLISSAAHMVTAAYVGARGRYPLLGLLGGVAVLSAQRVSQAAAQRSQQLLRNLEPQLAIANSYACVGLDQLEKTFPVLQQPAEEVMDQLRESFFVVLDDLQVRVNEGMDRITRGTERLVEQTRAALFVPLDSLQSSALGGTLSSALDELLTRTEEAADYYLPLPEALQPEWELSLRYLEDEEDDDDEEPGLWTRVRYLGLRLSLLLRHWALQMRDKLRRYLQAMGEVADTVGVTQLLETIVALSQQLMGFYVSGVYQLEELRALLRNQLSALAHRVTQLPPVRSTLALPFSAWASMAVVVKDLLELSQVLIQLLINSTPLYNMLQQLSEPQVEAYTSQEESSESGSPLRSSSNSFFPKGLEWRARRRRSSHGRPRRGSASPSWPPTPANGRRGSLKQDGIDTVSHTSHSPVRRSSATEVLLSPIMQLVSQSQRAFEYLSPGPRQEDPGLPLVETTEY